MKITSYGDRFVCEEYKPEQSKGKFIAPDPTPTAIIIGVPEGLVESEWVGKRIIYKDSFRAEIEPGKVQLLINFDDILGEITNG